MPGSAQLRARVEQLDRELEDRVGEALASLWDAQIATAAKAVADSAPHEQELLMTELRRGLATYPADLEQLLARAGELDGQLAVTIDRLQEAKDYKNDDEKATIDAVKSGHAKVRIELTRWIGSLRELDADVTGAPSQEPEPSGEPAPGSPPGAEPAPEPAAAPDEFDDDDHDDDDWETTGW